MVLSNVYVYHLSSAKNLKTCVQDCGKLYLVVGLLYLWKCCWFSDLFNTLYDCFMHLSQNSQSQMLIKQTHSTLNFYSSKSWHIQYLCRAGNEWQSPWSSFRPCGAVLRRSAAPLRDGADGGESDARRSPRARGQAETSARRRGRRGVPGDACSTGAQHGRPDQTCSCHRLQEGRTTALCDAFTID